LNCEFIAGKAEEVLTKIDSYIPHNSQVIGIVDPPMHGLHRDTLEIIKNCSQIDTLIYVSYKQSSLINDTAAYCTEIT